MRWLVETVEITPGMPLYEIRLPVVEVPGRVLAAGKPVAGARLSTTPVVPRGTALLLEQPRILTDADGRFRLELPASSQALDLAVLPPGYGARLARVPLPVEGQLDIAVDPAVGTLVLDLASFGVEPGARGWKRLGARLLQDGAGAAAAGLLGWARFQGAEPGEEGRWVIPGMSSGSYSLCLPVEGSLAYVSGFLPPNGEVTLAR